LPSRNAPCSRSTRKVVSPEAALERTQKKLRAIQNLLDSDRDRIE